MKNNAKPILYYKPTCGWCHEALTFFEKHKVKLDLRNISANIQYKEELLSVSAQRLVPTLKMDDFIVADFSVHELITALDKNPTAKKELGIH